MKLVHPSPEFDDSVAAVCHGTVTLEQAEALNTLLLSHPEARDEYLLRLEIHSRLGSEPDLLAPELPPAAACDPTVPTPPEAGIPRRTPTRTRPTRILAAAAGLTILAVLGWPRAEQITTPAPAESTSKAVAMLGRVVGGEWMSGGGGPAPGSPLEPGWLRLKSGLAQVVLYSGARVVIQGPAELKLISRNEVFFQRGQLVAEVPAQARGFRVVTPQADLTDLGTSFGLLAGNDHAEVHVFSGEIELRPTSGGTAMNLSEGEGASIDGSRLPQPIVPSPTLFASLFYLESGSEAADAESFERWRAASNQLNQDPSLLVHLDFEGCAATTWQLRNAGYPSPELPDASIVGCQWTNGRWPQKQALEFQGVNDRVRLSVPGDHESLTLAAWVRVQGLDRKINSLFMSDGFQAGTIHWSIRHDGVLGLTVIGGTSGNYQLVVSPPEISLEQFGSWIHLAVVIDGAAKRVVHYVNGRPVGAEALLPSPPFHIGAAEIGNWNPSGFPGKDSFLIRNFSGAMDEFTLFARALDGNELHSLYSAGKSQAESANPEPTHPQTK